MYVRETIVLCLAICLSDLGTELQGYVHENRVLTGSGPSGSGHVDPAMLATATAGEYEEIEGVNTGCSE